MVLFYRLDAAGTASLVYVYSVPLHGHESPGDRAEHDLNPERSLMIKCKMSLL